MRNAEILWVKGFMSIPQVARGSGLFKVMPIPQMTGNTREFSEIEMEEYARRKGQSEQAKRARVGQGFTKIGRLYRVAADFGASYEWRTQGKYPEIKSNLENLGKLVPNRQDLDLTHRLTFILSTSFEDMDGDTVDLTVGDTLALGSTVHTVRSSATTFRNILANNPAYSYGAFEAMKKMRIENSINQFGQKMTGSDDILWSSEDPNTVHTMRQVLGSTTDPTQNNPSVINPQAGTMRHVILPRLATDKDGNVDSTKAKYWGVASSTNSSAFLGVHEEARMKVPPVEGNSAEEFSTDDFNFGTRGGYLIVVVGASWIGFSDGLGTP